MLADIRSAFRAGESWTTLALVTDDDDAAYTQSGINALTVAVYDLSSETPTVNLWISAQPAVSAVFFNTLQTGSGWNRTPGFNFKHTVNPADLNGAINSTHVFKVRYFVETVLHGTRSFHHLITVLA